MFLKILIGFTVLCVVFVRAQISNESTDILRNWVKLPSLHATKNQQVTSQNIFKKFTNQLFQRNNGFNEIPLEVYEEEPIPPFKPLDEKVPEMLVDSEIVKVISETLLYPMDHTSDFIEINLISQNETDVPKAVDYEASEYVDDNFLARETTTEISETTTQFETTDLPSTTTETDLPSTTEVPTTTEYTTIEVDLPSTTEEQTTDLPSTTTDADLPSTTEITTTDILSTTEIPTTSDLPSTTDIPTTTDFTTDIPTTTDLPSTTDIPTTTDLPSTTDILTTTDLPSTTDIPTTTDFTTDIPTTTEIILTTTEIDTTTDTQTTETTTKLAYTTTKPPTTTQIPFTPSTTASTTETTTTTESVVSKMSEFIGIKNGTLKFSSNEDPPNFANNESTDPSSFEFIIGHINTIMLSEILGLDSGVSNKSSTVEPKITTTTTTTTENYPKFVKVDTLSRNNKRPIMLKLKNSTSNGNLRFRNKVRKNQEITPVLLKRRKSGVRKNTQNIMKRKSTGASTERTLTKSKSKIKRRKTILKSANVTVSAPVRRIKQKLATPAVPRKTDQKRRRKPTEKKRNKISSTQSPIVRRIKKRKTVI